MTMATKSNPAPGSTPFDDGPAKPPKKKRYSPAMQALHQCQHILKKLTPQEQMQVFQYLKVQYEPPLLNGGLELHA